MGCDCAERIATALATAAEKAMAEERERCLDIAEFEKRLSLSNKKLDAYSRCKNIASAIRAEGGKGE